MSVTLPGFMFLASGIVFVATVLFLAARKVAIVYPPDLALLYRDGRFERELPPGRHVWFDAFHRTRTVTLSMAELPSPLGEFTVVSKDQFSFRMALAPVVRIVDARLFSESQPAVEPYRRGLPVPMISQHMALHPLAAAAAMAAAGEKTLAELLADQPAVAEAVRTRLENAVPGAAIERVLVTGINLPPETRRMFTDVERARMEAQAALERARGEQAALRVLANAARLVNDNPALANLRLLQTIESAKGSTTIVLGDTGAMKGLGVPTNPPGAA